MTYPVTYKYHIMFPMLDFQQNLLKDSGCFEPSIKDCISNEIRKESQHGTVRLDTAYLVCRPTLVLVFQLIIDKQTHNRLKLTKPDYISALSKRQMHYERHLAFMMGAYKEGHDPATNNSLFGALKEAGYA